MSRIVFICRRFCPGQAWTNRLLGYAKGFAEQGKEVVLLFLITDNNRTPYTINIPNVKVINLWENDNKFVRLHRALSFVVNKRKIRNYINDGDVCFMTDASGFFIDEIIKSRKKVKIVFESTEHPMIFSNATQNTVQRLLQKLKSVDKLFVISEALKRYYISEGVDGRKIHVINMFVDTTRFKGVKKTENRKYIAYCGTVSYQKDGVDLLIRAFSMFKNKFPDYILEIYGSGTSETIEKLKELAKENDVADSVIFTGPIPYTEMPNKLVNATILALSRPNNLQNQNGFPTKLGEYLMTGNPVVTTSVGEIPCFIKDGYNGYLAKPDSVESFAEKLKEVACNLEKAKLVGEKGREIAFKEFSYLTQTQKAFQYIYESK